MDSAEEEYRQLEKMERRFKEWIMADVWTAAFFVEKTEHDLEFYPTNATLESIRENQPVRQVLIENVLRIADQYNFFHYHLEFPEVFEKGGFDCLLGNPPWEQIQLEEKAYFEGKINFEGKKGNERKEIIHNLKMTNPDLNEKYILDLRFYNISNHFFEQSNRYDLVTEGRNNTYSLFTYLAYQIINHLGIVGYIVPTGISTDFGNRFFFQFLVENKKIISIIDFENRRALFKDVEANMRFTLLSISKSRHEHLKLAFGLIEPEQLNEIHRFYNLTSDEFFLFNPNTKTCPVFKTSIESNIAKKIYSNFPILINELNPENPFNIQFKQGLFNMTTDSNYFHKKEEL
ncbi:MAG: hypothetical protein HC905_06595 [Bacteroidales bacterium]|nr:hypothetical protein [Bacteroidales bacterium]